MNGTETLGGARVGVHGRSSTASKSLLSSLNDINDFKLQQHEVVVLHYAMVLYILMSWRAFIFLLLLLFLLQMLRVLSCG